MDTSLPTNLTVVVPDVLLSYCYVAQPYMPRTGNREPSFCTHGVFSRGHAAEQIVTATIVEICKNAWGSKMVEQAVMQPDGSTIIKQMPEWQAMLTQFKQENRLPLKDGNKRKPLADPYKNNLYVSANNPSRPRIVVTRGGVNVEIGPDDPMFPYSGARGNLIIDFWAQGCPAKPVKDPTWGSRINAQLAGIQFLSHGSRLGGGGGRAANLDEFGICPADADAPPPGAAVENESLV
jgi:hypothetical protein